MNESRNRPPLIAHVINSMKAGGLENGLVNLINNMPEDRYRHAVICITDYSDFRFRVKRKGVEFFAMKKRPGKDIGIYSALYRLFGTLRPTIVHSRNLAGLDSQMPAWLAGVECRIHAEHGRDMIDLDGQSRKYRLIRRMHSPIIDRFVSVSKDLESYLREAVGIPERKISQIYNGVDIKRFSRTASSRTPLPYADLSDPEKIVIGSVSRMQKVKDPLNLAHAFVILVRKAPDLRARLRLVLSGDGPLQQEVSNVLRDGGVQDLSYMPGFVDDVPQFLRGLDIFVLPSLAEGISNTILEAMAVELPVVATGVGGTVELVVDGETGRLVAPGDPEALAAAVENYARNPVLARSHGRNGRQRVEREFSLPVMVGRYLSLYDGLLSQKAGRRRTSIFR